MAFEYIIWGLIGMTTLGLVLSLKQLKLYLIKKKVFEMNPFEAKEIVIRFIASMTVLLTIVWWFVLLIFQVYTNEVSSVGYNIAVMLIIIPVLTFAMYFLFTFVQKFIEKSFQIKVIETKGITFIRSITLVASLIYASMINYGVQLIFIILNQS